MLPGIKRRVKIYKEYMEISGYYVQSVMIKCWPNEAKTGIILDLIRFEYDEMDDISVVTAFKITQANLLFNFFTDIKMNRLDANIKTALSRGKASDEAREEEVKALQALKYMKRNRKKNKYYDVWLAVTVSSKSLESLKNYMLSFTDHVDAYGIKLNTSPYQQHRILSACWGGKSGYGINNSFLNKNYGRVLDLSAIQAFNPLLDGSISDGPGAAYIGHRYFEQTPVYIDFTKGPAGKHMLIMGDTGAGKTFMICTIAGSLLACGFKVYIFDVNNEYRNFCKSWGGIYIDQTKKSGKYYDPCKLRKSLQKQLNLDTYSESDRQKIIDADEARYTDAVQATKGMVTLLAGELTSDEDDNLDNAITKMYETAGISMEDMNTWDDYNCDECSIHKLYQYIKQEDAGLAKRLRKFFEGSQRNTFSIEDNADELEKAQLVVISVANTVDSQVEQHMGTVKTVMAQNTVWYLVTLERYKKECFTAIVDDEIQRRMKNKYASDEIFKIVTNGRRYNTQLIAATNTPQIIFNTDEGQALWDNTNYKVFLKAEKNTVDCMAEKAGLPPEVINMWYDLKNHEHAVIFGKMNIIYDMIKSELPPDEESDYETRGLKKGAS